MIGRLTSEPVLIAKIRSLAKRRKKTRVTTPK